VSNCDFVAWGSLIDLATSRLPLRAPALRAALTRPNRSAQRLPCGRHAVPTTKTVGPSNVVANHRIECRDHLPHHRNDHDFRQFAGGFQTIVKDFERRIPITGTHRGHIKHLAHVSTPTPDAASSLHRTALEGIGRHADQPAICLRLMQPSSGKSAINVQANSGPTPGMEQSNR